MNRGHTNERIHTNFANSGRIAGIGISYDRYDDESGCPEYDYKRGRVKFPSDNLNPEERNSLNGPVIIVKKGN